LLFTRIQSPLRSLYGREISCRQSQHKSRFPLPPPTQHHYTEPFISQPPCCLPHNTPQLWQTPSTVCSTNAVHMSCLHKQMLNILCILPMHLAIIGAVYLATDSAIKYRPVSHLAAKGSDYLTLCCVKCQLSEWHCVVTSGTYLSCHVRMLCTVIHFKYSLYVQ
jgi:hypothetical protein